MSEIILKKIALLEPVLNELNQAESCFGPFNSAHEGYAVILEELDELWEEIKTKNSNPKRLKKEAVQVAAMALRFLKDVCEVE